MSSYMFLDIVGVSMGANAVLLCCVVEQAEGSSVTRIVAAFQVADAIRKVGMFDCLRQCVE